MSDGVPMQEAVSRDSSMVNGGRTSVEHHIIFVCNPLFSFEPSYLARINIILANTERRLLWWIFILPLLFLTNNSSHFVVLDVLAHTPLDNFGVVLLSPKYTISQRLV